MPNARFFDFVSALCQSLFDQLGALPSEGVGHQVAFVGLPGPNTTLHAVEHDARRSHRIGNEGSNGIDDRGDDPVPDLRVGRYCIRLIAAGHPHRAAGVMVSVNSPAGVAGVTI